MSQRLTIEEVPDGQEEAAGGVKGFIDGVSSWFSTNKYAKRATVVSRTVGGATWKATVKVGEYAWIIGATAVVVVLPLMLEMERETTYQLQAEMMQKQVMEIQRSAQAGGTAAATP